MGAQDRGSTRGGHDDRSHAPLPAGVMAVLPVRNTVLFPSVIAPLSIGREGSIAAAKRAARDELPIAIVQQRDPGVDHPGRGDLYSVATESEILRHVTAPDGSHHIICHGIRRLRLLELVGGYPFLAARVEPIEEQEVMTADLEARVEHLRREASEAAELLPTVPTEIAGGLKGVGAAGVLADMVAHYIDLKAPDKQQVLETFDVESRVARVSALLAHRLAVLRLSQEIEEQTKEAVDKHQREYLLREQMKAIQRELGEGEPRAGELAELREAIDRSGMTPEAEEEARRELGRLERMPEQAAEYTTIRTYLDWLTALPWSKRSDELLDVSAAHRVLDADHYGLPRVKRRILEYLAVRQLNPSSHGPILCLVGPPGVGKTSLGRSVARATGREFVRASLGGIHDESEIRGHRRTYVGAMPGTIIQSLRKAGTANPVFMLDEVDKLGAGFQGDPSAALLEVLDPEQNATFRDNYLGVAFDLSQIMFIATANRTDTIPAALLDRTELIDLPGYTEDEKLAIAQRYLVRRQREAAGLDAERCTIDEDALRGIIRDYTRESGVRNLERRIAAVYRYAAMKIAEGKRNSLSVGPDDLGEILGPPEFEREVAMRVSVPGVATGLAWTPAGGDILFVEATGVPGSGKLVLTGQLGDVMKESGRAALTLVKSRADRLGIDARALSSLDVHVHVPAGAIPKDGPSAGVAMFVSLVSQLTGRIVRRDTAMTGEISLRGLVLPVGGIKEKAVAAARAGIARVLVPARNRKDFEEIPEAARNQLEFIWIEDVDDAVEAAFEAPLESNERQAASG